MIDIGHPSMRETANVSCNGTFMSLVPPPIDWQRVRIDAAIAAMNGYCANPQFEAIPVEEINALSMMHANDMVERLKEAAK